MQGFQTVLEKAGSFYKYKKENRTYSDNRHAKFGFLTGVPGIEPGSGVLETLILPMNYTPIVCRICKRLIKNSIQFPICQGKES